MFPDAIIIGAARSGTSWLMKALHEHPDVHIPLKEIHYFTTYREKGVGWYRSFFTDEAKVNVEKSVSYFRAESAGIIKETVPDADLILILRDPIERVYSQYKMRLSFGDAGRDIEQALSPDSAMVREGLYYRHLENFLRHFSRDKLNIFLFEDFKEDNGRFFADVCRVLGVDERFEPSLLGEKYNPSRVPPRHQWLTDVKNSLVNFLHEFSLGDRLISMAKSNGLEAVFYRLNRGGDPPALPDGLRRRLAEFYREDTRRLQAFLDRDLSHWSPLALTRSGE